MKKILLLLCVLFFTVGCTNINKLDYKKIIDTSIKANKNNKIVNTYRNGYKYYLPKYMNVKDGFNYNEKLNSNYYTYYLYVDIISYYNKIKLENNENKDSYIYYYFNYEDDFGYLEVNKVDSQYIVEIIYNYAKIEVRVDKNDINEAINNAITILSTMRYDDDIIDNLIGDNKINSNEEGLKIFEDKKPESDFLEIIEEYDTYIEEENDIPDYDVIN